MQANETDIDLAANDLGPLAWVLDELRKSLDSASAALRRYVRDAGLARGTDMASVDTGQLRIARQQLHQAVGALEMVGLGAPAHILRSMEAAAQKFVERPELCSEAAAAKVERAGFALTEYLEGVLLGKPASAVALFPLYRDTQELAGADRVHPADLWAFEWRWIEPDAPAGPSPLTYDPSVRSRMDQSVLRVVKSGDAKAARELSQISLALAATQPAKQPRIFWKICAAYFESLSMGLLPLDIYVKRAASRVLLQYASLARGDLGVSDRLAQDLVFFCSQAAAENPEHAPALTAVRQAWSLARFQPVDYQTSPYGRFDPVLLAQARKRITVAKETWSSLSGGDANKLKGVADQFNLVCDSLLKLHPASGPLAHSLKNVVDAVVHSGRPPAPELAMEVATAVLYLEAAFEDLDPSDSTLALRTARLAERLDTARHGGQPEALETWMEELYRRVSDRQTMGSVVGELRSTLSELEKLLDQFFRNPQDKTPLRNAPAHLSQMRGVLSVLGLDQAAHAVLRMRESVEEIMVTEIDEEQVHAAGTFDKLGNNLGALGFLIDMLNYQPSLAKKLFVYDDAKGELKPLMGRAAHAPVEGAAPAGQLLSHEVMSVVSEAGQTGDDKDLGVKLDALANRAVLEEQNAVAHSAREAAAAVSAQDSGATSAALQNLAAAVQVAPPAAAAATAAADNEEDDLRDIFLEEAREVVHNGLAAVATLADSAGDLSELTTLRRAFHTLKGSSRMVGLTEFGEAAWSMEQVLNTWLADQKPASDGLLRLAGDALTGFGRWVEDIAAQNDGAWKAPMFRIPADAMRTDGRLLPISVPQVEIIEAAELPPLIELVESPAQEAAPAEPLVTAVSFDATQVIRAEVPPPAVAEIDASELTPDFDFEQVTLGGPADVPAAPPEAPLQAVPEIEGIDLAGLAALSDSQAHPEAELVLPPIEEVPVVAASEPVAAEPEWPEPVVPHEPSIEQAGVADDQVKVIGPLRIGIPLYNVYLNEADEWSRRLVTEVTEWALELDRPVPDSTVGLAHALAGSSATVGFHALSDIARALESALGHAQALVRGTPQHGQAFVEAAEEIRRLLHQFAAGFLKKPEPHIVQTLQSLKEIAAPHRADVAEPAQAMDLDELDFAEPAPPVAEIPAAAHVDEVIIPVVLPEPIAQAAVAEVPKTVDGERDQDDFDIADAVDPDLFPIFEEEALELLPQLGGALRQWVARPDNRSARDEVLRALHTLKGSARLAGALRLGEMAHRMESEIEYLGSENVNAVDLEPLLQRLDNLQGNFETVRATGGLPPELPVAEAPTAAAEFEAPTVVPAAAAAANDAGMAPGAPLAARPKHAVLAMPVTSTVAAQRAASTQAVRVRSQLLDRLVNQAGEVMITRSRLEAELKQLRSSLNDLTGNLDRLRSQLRDIELQAESQMQSRLAQAKDSAANFDPLEFDRFTRVQELTRMMAESVNDVATVQRNLQRTVELTEDDLIAQARQTRELQRDLLRTRMVEFEGISDRLYRVVRQASKETGKQVKLDITGGSIEMDRGVLDRMTPAFEHLLRNCVVHGIEDPALRVQEGKDATGTVLIGLHHEGNDVSVEFRDDGAGLDMAGIRAKALQQGLLAPGQELSDNDAATLIFTPGFSTAAQVTELAGRGIGMDVVRSEVNALGGRIETTTKPGKGTTFKLVLPLTTAVTQVVMIRSGNLAVGVPANLVEIVRRAPAKDVQQAYNTGYFEFGGEQLPFFWSGALLQASPRSVEAQGKTLPVVVFRSAAQRIAVHVDEVLGNQEVVVKNLGPQLARLPGLAGMSLLASGAVVLIYNPVALTTVYGEQARQFSADRAQPEVLEGAGGSAAVATVDTPPQIPLVLVVDDSITVRRVTQRLLQREGYRVALANDGLQALERLAEERPSVVLSDIEMPRMDGFDLARNIRGDARMSKLPIIMITSRIAEKHREHAMSLGVNGYLGKPYSEEELLSLIKHYCSAEVAA